MARSLVGRIARRTLSASVIVTADTRSRTPGRKLDLCSERRPMSARASRCPVCRYDLTGLTQPRCPECGQTFSAAEWADPHALVIQPALERLEHAGLFRAVMATFFAPVLR